MGRSGCAAMDMGCAGLGVLRAWRDTTGAGTAEGDAESLIGTGGAADGAGAGSAEAMRGMEIWVADGVAI